MSDIFIAYRCPGGRNTLLRAMSDPDFQYTAKSKKPLYIYISVRDFHSLVKITRFSVIRDFKKPLYIYISVGLAQVTSPTGARWGCIHVMSALLVMSARCGYEIFSDVSPVEEIECQRFS